MEQIAEFVKRQPFQPFDIKMSDGRVYTVDHPEFVAIGRRASTVIFVTDDDRTIFLDANHITTLEVANRAAA